MKPMPFLLIALAITGFAAYHFALPHRRASVLEVAPTPLATSEGREVPTRDFLSALTKPKPERPLAERAPARAPQINVENATLPWEKQILDILQNPATDGTKGQQILALLPTLPEEALGTATEQALPWITDAEYTDSVMPMLLNVQTHGAVMAELYKDLVERPPQLALPSLLLIARIPEHPFAATAHDSLALMLGQDLANDWSAWDGAVRQRLATGQ